jgi:pilus assembly protein CpaC
LASSLVLSVVLAAAEPTEPAKPSTPSTQGAAGQQATPAKPEALLVTVGKTLIIDSPLDIERIAIANENLVDAVPIHSKEVLVNGKSAGETSLIIWQKNGQRLVFELTVRANSARLEAVRQQVAREFPDADINITYDNEAVFVRGTVKDVLSADRVQQIASTLGRVVNLLRVEVPAEDPQFVLKVKFADIDRSASQELGAQFAQNNFNTPAGIGTISPPISTNGGGVFSVPSIANILLFRKDINLVSAIQALESKNKLQMLAEPNVMAINGKQASFLAGGEFPFPQVQPGGNGAITIVFKEFGVRLNFIPTMTPRGTIRLQVAPEVSSLDFTHALTIQGLPVPGLTTRRIQTEVELEAGQSFVLGGLMDNELTESFSKIPGIGSIPVLGNLFKTRSVTRNNSELLVIITPELVRPYAADQQVPMFKFDKFMPRATDIPLWQPGIDKTGPVPVHPPTTAIPLEQLIQQQRVGQPAPPAASPTIQIIQPSQGQPNVNPGLTPPPAAAGGGGGGH